jgi:hypothetical protein
MDGRLPHPADLDDAIQGAAGALVEPGELIVSWVVLAATRNASDGGTVLVIPSNAAMPAWEVKGILEDARDSVRTGQMFGGEEEGPPGYPNHPPAA